MVVVPASSCLNVAIALDVKGEIGSAFSIEVIVSLISTGVPPASFV